MDKPSPLTWQSRAKVQAHNYGYRRPLSAVRIRDEKDKYAHVQSRCEPHVNCLEFPPRQKVDDYSWIHETEVKAKRLPPDHPMSPERIKQTEKEREEREEREEIERKVAAGELVMVDGEYVEAVNGVPKTAGKPSDSMTNADTMSDWDDTMSNFSNFSSFASNTGGSGGFGGKVSGGKFGGGFGAFGGGGGAFGAPAKKKTSNVMGKKDSGFGEVEKFTAHKAGGHFSSKTKSLLEITRKDEIDLQKQRDMANAKAKFVLSGGKLI